VEVRNSSFLCQRVKTGQTKSYILCSTEGKGKVSAGQHSRTLLSSVKELRLNNETPAITRKALYFNNEKSKFLGSAVLKEGLPSSKRVPKPSVLDVTAVPD